MKKKDKDCVEDCKVEVSCRQCRRLSGYSEERIAELEKKQADREKEESRV